MALPKIIPSQLYRLSTVLRRPDQMSSSSLDNLPLPGVEQSFGMNAAVGSAETMAAEGRVPDFESDLSLSVCHPEIDRLIILPEFPRSLGRSNQIPHHIQSPPSPVTYRYRWDRHGRKGGRCCIFARGTMNSVGLVFEDGFRMVSSGNALRRA